MKCSFPRIVVAGAHSGVGKTTISLALVSALTARGFRVQAFKVGPDYIPGDITVNGQYAGDESMIWNATPSIPVNIGVNCTNVGISDVDITLTYSISFYNSTATRTIGEEFDNVSMLSGLTVGGDSGQQIGAWIPPNQPGDRRLRCRR